MNKFNANPRFTFLNNLDIDQDVKSKLSINLNRIYTGNKEVYVTPMGNKASFILDEWTEVFESNKSLVNDILYNIEKSQLEKSGPRSIAKPWDQRREGITSYFEDEKLDYSTLDAVPPAKPNLRPLSVDNATKYLKRNTSSGLPFYLKKGLVLNRVKNSFDYLLKRKDPCVLFTRTQEQGKTRDVWGYPIADTLNEMRFYIPLLEFQRKLSWRVALNGPDKINQEVSKIINESRRLGYVLVSIDFSNYDRSLKQGLQFKIFEYIKSLFQSSFSSDLDYIVNRKSTIGLVTPDGVISGPHGEPSGSTFTNEDDSIAQYLISRQSGVVSDGLFSIQGDDGIYAVPEDKIISLFKSFENFGLNVNEDKSYRSSDYVVYLQNLYHNDYSKDGVIKGIYPTFRALNRLLYQERWSNFEEFEIEGKDYYSIRAISILENCKHHPLFEKLVNFVVKHDKYGLRPSQKGIRQYVDMMSSSSGIEGLLYNQYSDDVKGIRNFETFKIIMNNNKA